MSIKDNHMTELEGESLNITEHNIEQLKQLFPNVFTEGKIDFDALKSELGEHIETNDERYQFTWAGKEQAKRIATTPTLGTLRPAPDESVDWNTTENLYIEGDNLEVLKLLQKSYFNQVKMIYIDPPYNTGKDFVYKDDFKDNLANYQRLTGQLDEEGNPLSTNRDSAGRYHSNWLNMMYPRLKLARNLLRDDGVIVLSIDEKEFHNLRKICDEIFGEENYAGEIIWKNSSKNDQSYISIQHEYFIFYVKNKQSNPGLWFETKQGLDEIYKAFDEFKKIHNNDWQAIHSSALDWFKKFPDSHPVSSHKHYSWMDERGIYFPDNISGPNHGQYVYDVIHPITNKVCKSPASGWRYPKEELLKRIEENRVHFGVDETTVPCNKTYLKNTEVQSITSIKNVDGRGATNRLARLFSAKVFTNPKDEILLSQLMQAIGVKDNDIVMDFFSGSATTAEALFLLNQKQKSACKFILVQIPENLHHTLKVSTGGAKRVVQNAIDFLKKEKKEAFLTEIGKERIRRAAAKIREDHPDTEADLGFKVFKLDTSNIKKWQPTVDTLADDLFDAVDNIEEERTPADLLYEVLLKYGLPLTLPVEEITLGEHTAFNVAMGSLVACFDENITLETVQAIIELSSEETPVLRVVFRDNGFQDDIVKTNAIQRLKQAGIEDILSI